MGHPRHPFSLPSCASDLTNPSGRHCAFTLLTRYVKIIFLSGPYAQHAALRGERGVQPHPTGRAFMGRACDPIPVRLGRLHPAPLDPAPAPPLPSLRAKAIPSELYAPRDQVAVLHGLTLLMWRDVDLVQKIAQQVRGAENGGGGGWRRMGDTTRTV